MKKHLYILMACLIALLAVCVCAPTVSAHTSIYPGYQPYTPIQRSMPVREPNVSIVRFQNRTSIFPSIVACHIGINCLTISNRTGRTITLYLNGRWYVTMWAGETISPTLTWGRNVFTIAGVYRFVMLVVVVQRPMPYSWGWQPMQRSW